MRLEWADSLKYLGIMFSAGSALSVNTSYIKRKFYMACNGILGYCRSVTEFVKLGLVRAFCLPLLTYCVGALDLTVSCTMELAVCWNDCSILQGDIWLQKAQIYEVIPTLLFGVGF